MSYLRLSLLLPLIALLAGCGYHVGGKADLLPKSIQTIAIGPFGNTSIRYKLNDKLPAAIAEEFIARTRYRIVNDPTTADAILDGGITSYSSSPVIIAGAGQATSVQVSVVATVTLKERATGRVLYNRPNFGLTQNYEISTRPDKYFDESEFTLTRICRDMARSIVSGVLENF